MSVKRTGKTSVSGGTDWAKLRGLSDPENRRAVARDPEAHPTNAEFWKGARVVMPRPKQTVTIRLDADLLEWLRAQKGYQTRINAVLRSWMEAKGAERHG